jgi:hypothetical protein
MTRLFALGLLLVFVSFSSGDAKSIKQNCKDQCVSAYKFCLNRSLTDKARKNCKIDEKFCKGNCH